MNDAPSFAKRPVVLVVDDTPLNLQVATGILRPDYQALAAIDGPRALEVAGRRPDIDVILLDIMMPGMDGFEVCRRLKADPKTAHLPVVFLTALDDAETREQAAAVGGTDLLTKPILPERLLARVASLVGMGAGAP